jgi:hypothetical protein
MEGSVRGKLVKRNTTNRQLVRRGEELAGDAATLVGAMSEMHRSSAGRRRTGKGPIPVQAVRSRFYDCQGSS